MSRFRKLLLGAALILPAAAGAQTYHLGRPALPEEIAAWNVKIMPDGRGLPEGQGSVEDGEMLFSDRCATCHGEFAEGVGRFPALAGGDGTLAREDPVKTVGSFWPYLSTVWDYAHRSMPYGDAQSLTADETYAIVAYILYSNGVVEDDFVLSKANFAEVKLPNADGFIADDRDAKELAEFQKPPCMENCKATVEITRRAANLDVTPGDAEDGDAGAVDLEGGAAPAEAATPPAEAAGAPEAAGTETVDPGAAPVPATPAAPAAVETGGDTTAEAAAAVAAADGGTDPAAPAAAPAPPAMPATTEADPAAVPAATAAAPVAAATSEADPALIAAGEKVFTKCKACHQVGDKAKNAVGPILNGVVGRKAAAVEGYKYSKAMTDAGLTWDSETLHKYLADPKGFMPGNKMSFAGLKKPADIDAVVAVLATHP